MAINISDRSEHIISKKEAIVIAQQFFIEKDLDKEVELSKARVRKKMTWYRLPNGSSVTDRPPTTKYDALTTWEVAIPAKRKKGTLLRTYLVADVNVNTGKVEDYGPSKW